MKKVFLPIFLIVLLVACNNEPKSILDGESVNFIGDSITDYSKYPKEVKSILGLASAENYGVGGSSFCYRNELHPDQNIDEDYPPLVSRWDEIEEAKIHFILIGTNDYSSQVPFGSEDSTNPEEFNGCLNIVLSGLKEKHPNSKIIISTILKRKDDGLPVPVTEYNKIIESKAKEYEIILFDGYNIDGLDIGNDYDGEITDDRLHPNKQGAKILSEAVSDFLENL